MSLVGCLVFLVLNPYALVGPLGYYVALPFFCAALFFGVKNIKRKIAVAFLVCIAISLIGVFSSIFHGITQFEHLKVATSIGVYYLIGIGLFVVFGKGQDIDNVLLATLYVGVVNGIVILGQVQFPQFRAVVESIFVESGNIDWAEGFRYRGLASGGGASLSVLSALMVYICLYLYDVKKINATIAIVSLAVLILSVFFIGRTGVLLMAVAFGVFIILNARKNIKTIVFILGILAFAFTFGFDLTREFLIQEYGEGFYKYSLGFMLDGKQGFDDEGTVGIIADFLMTVPTQFPEILIGYGFYGGSDFYPWTDSGYARMFLSVGFLFGLIFYGCTFYIFNKSVAKKGVLFWPLILLLAIAEAKEGLMFSGYASRLVFILMGFWAAQKSNTSRQASKKFLNTSAS